MWSRVTLMSTIWIWMTLGLGSIQMGYQRKGCQICWMQKIQLLLICRRCLERIYTLLERHSKILLDISSWIHTCIKEDLLSIRNSKRSLELIAKSKGTGLRVRIRNLLRRLKVMAAKIGKKLQKVYKKELMYSVCIDGKRY